MIYGYARVSTHNQELDVQLQALEENKCDVIYKEKMSGKSVKQRPELEKLLAAIQPGDTLIVTRLDRLARSVVEGAALIEKLFNRGIRVHLLNIGIIENTTMGRLMLNVLLSIAEFERNTIVERTQEGRELARQNPNYREGRPKKYSKQQMDHAMSLLENHTFPEVVELTGISISTLKRESAQRKKASLLQD